MPLAMSTREFTEPNNGKSDDEILEIFFDESFVPQAFVDILLSNAAEQGLSQAQTVSSSLLSRLDYYTKNLTKELQLTVRKLENLSEALPAAWATDVTADYKESEVSSKANIGRPSKLEYYLDTLASAVRTIDGDMGKIDGQLDELNHRYSSSEKTADKLKKLELVKKRLQKSSQTFTTIRGILDIAIAPQDKRLSESQQTVSVSDFESSLETLQETISQSLLEASNNEGPSERNQDLLDKIDQFVDLKPLFKDLDKFQPVFSEFAETIKGKAQDYLSMKDFNDDHIA